MDMRLKHDLRDVPHSLQLDHIFNIKYEKRVCILERIESEGSQPCGFEEEVIRRNNFLSLLYFTTQKENKKALEINSKVCEKDQTNITALVNKAVMTTRTGHEYASQIAVGELQQLRTRDDYKQLLVVATAEQAYCMSRMGPHFLIKAIDLYENVIKEFPEHYLWKFGCALTCNRCLGFPKCVKDMTPERVKEFCERAVRYLSEITIHCNKQPLIAKAFVELAYLYQLLKQNIYPLTRQIVEQVKTEGRSLTAEQCLDKALETVHKASLKDAFVLGRCGKLLQYARPSSQYGRTLPECYKLLEQAYAIRPSASICDELAKILFKLTEQTSGNAGGRKCDRGRGRGGLRGQGQPGNHGGGTEMPNKDQYGRSMSEQQRSLAVESSLNAGAAECVPKMQASSDQHLVPDSDLASEFWKLSIQSHESPQNQLRGGRSSHKFKKMLNSPKEVVKYPNDEYLKKAVQYLQESINMTKGCNHNAMYQLGLTNRRLDQVETAEEQFRKIITDLSASLYHKSVAYEQIGFCLFEKIEGSQYSDKQKQSFREEGMMMMRRSIEQATLIFVQSPTMGKDALPAWEALPTLKQLLTNTPNKPESIKEVASLYALVGEHSDAIEYYEQLLRVNPDDPSLLSQVINQYMFSGDFENAQACLNLLLCTREGRRMADNEQDLVYQVYLGTAKYLLASEPTSSSKESIRSCFQRAFNHRHGHTSNEDDRTWDVFVLDDPEQTDAEADTIQSWFRETCGLSVTRNGDDALGYEIEHIAEINAINNCKCLVVLLGKETATKRLEYLVAVSQRCESLDVILPVLTCKKNILQKLEDKRPVVLPPDFLTCQPAQPLMNIFLSLLKLDHIKFKWRVEDK